MSTAATLGEHRRYTAPVYASDSGRGNNDVARGRIAHLFVVNSKRRATGGGVLVITLLAMLAAGSRLGCWLIVEDALQPATAIVVLNGEKPDRAFAAAALYLRRWAPEIWLTQLPDSEELAQRIRLGDIVDAGTQSNLRALRKAGVPAEAVRVLREPIRNTQDELRVVRAATRSSHAEQLIIVTSKPHTRRTRVLWDRLAGAPPIVVRHAGDDRWDLVRWWAHEEERGAVIHEVFGLIIAYAPS